jgi:hypothetical protein
MSVGFDAATLSSQFTSVSAFTFEHTPSGTPSGVVIALGADLSATDHINGTVSYGGVATSRITFAADTAGSTGGAWLYHVGASIPTGAQVVSISHDASAVTKVAACITFTAARDTYVSASSRTFENRADPTVLIDSGSTEGMGIVALFSGRNTVSGGTVLANMTSGASFDFGSEVWRWDYETTPATSSRSLGYDMTSSDGVALVAGIISEIAAVVSAFTTPSKRPLRIPPVPSGLTGPLAEWCRTAARQLNAEAYISTFSAANPNTSGLTGIPGNLAVNIGSASTTSRLWILGGGIVSIDTNDWHPVRIA